jgi:hypothetical protein
VGAVARHVRKWRRVTLRVCVDVRTCQMSSSRSSGTCSARWKTLRSRASLLLVSPSSFHADPPTTNSRYRGVR